MIWKQSQMQYMIGGIELKQDEFSVFIGTPLAGQGEVFNEEWIKARLDLFEAVTLPSLLKQLKEGVYWMVFLGWEVPEIVQDYVDKNLTDIPHLYLLNQRRDHETMKEFALKHCETENFITCSIADDDAWPVDHMNTVVNTSIELKKKGHDHVGFAYKYGYEWVVSDIVDLNFKDKGFDIIIPEMLLEYNHPWLGHAIFVLQTVDRPFAWMAASHVTFPEWLKKENFDVVEIDEPKKTWLYARHQLADSGIIKSNNRPMDFRLEDLEEHFGIDAGKVRQWQTGPYSSLHCEKNAHQKGHIEMYDLSNKAGFVKRPYNFLHSEPNQFRFNPYHEFGVTGRCRLTVWDTVAEEHFLFLNFDADLKEDIILHHSLFPETKDCKFDIRMWNGEKWYRTMAYIKFDFGD